jgi:hypothetical protein
LSVVLCMYVTCLLTLTHGHNAEGVWRKDVQKTHGDNTTGNDIDSDNLHYLYFSPNVSGLIKSRKMNGKNMFRTLEWRAYLFLVGTLEGERPRERSRRRWEYKSMMH